MIKKLSQVILNKMLSKALCPKSTRFQLSIIAIMRTYFLLFHLAASFSCLLMTLYNLSLPWKHHPDYSSPYFLYPSLALNSAALALIFPTWVKISCLDNFKKPSKVSIQLTNTLVFFLLTFQQAQDKQKL